MVCVTLYLQNEFGEQTSLKEKVIPKNYFLSSPITNKDLAFREFHSSKFQPLMEVPAILKKFLAKEATLESSILNLSWQPCRQSVRCDVNPSDSKLVARRKGHKVNRIYYFLLFIIFYLLSTEFIIFPSDYPFHCLQCYRFVVWTFLAQNKMAQEQL